MLFQCIWYHLISFQVGLCLSKRFHLLSRMIQHHVQGTASRYCVSCLTLGLSMRRLLRAAMCRLLWLILRTNKRRDGKMTKKKRNCKRSQGMCLGMICDLTWPVFLFSIDFSWRLILVTVINLPLFCEDFRHPSFHEDLWFAVWTCDTTWSPRSTSSSVQVLLLTCPAPGLGNLFNATLRSNNYQPMSIGLCRRCWQLRLQHLDVSGWDPWFGWMRSLRYAFR